ncbi:MAG: hypothetical protein H6842_12545 [Rhodospirillaceae bacterium]|nr:hypothetical protein [Rhodospirillaceae bacterium]
MPRPFTLLIALACGFPLADAAGQAINTVDRQRFAGLYCGLLETGGAMVPAYTRFEAAGQTITGSYGFADGTTKTGIAEGTLGECRLTQGAVLACTWQDSYGSGDFEARFSDDATSFSGHWTLGQPGLPGAFAWSGERAGAAVSGPDCLSQ